MSETKSKAEKAYIIAKKFVDDLAIINFNDNFYKYNGKIWEYLESDFANAMISTNYLQEFNAPLTSDIKEVVRNINNISHISFNKQIKEAKDSSFNGDINLLDNIYNIDTDKLRDYTKNEFKFHHLSFNYDPTKKLSKDSIKLFTKFLCDIMEVDITGELDKETLLTIGFIQEWFGYSLMAGNKFHKSLIMTGGGRNGKGVLKNIWSKLIGSNNISYIDLHAINDDKYIHKTRDKLLNFSTDLKHGVQLDTGVIKAAVSGEEVTSNEKYKQQHTFNFTAKLIILCNDLPYIKTVGAAVSDRFYVLPFNKTISAEEMDYDLSNKLEKELEGIFIWAIIGLKRLKTIGSFTPPLLVERRMKQFLYDNDNIEMFLTEQDLVYPDGKSSKVDLYADYKNFCLSSGYKAMGRNKFYDAMKKKGFKETRDNADRYFLGVNNVSKICF